MLDLSTLNPPQLEAVRTLEGPLLVLAGAGSGKTRVIVHRIAYMVEQGIAPSSILGVTFTNKAASEMRERVAELVGRRNARQLTISTFHAFGCEVLRRYITRLGYPKKFAIADAGDQLSLIRRVMKEIKVDDRSFDAKRVLALISKAKCAGQVPQPSPEGQGDDYDLITAKIYPRYELGLRVQGTVDFDDLILLPIRLLRDHPDARAGLRDRYRYLLVDEYQDTNRTQLELLIELAGERRNVCAVGDDDQSIYSWRGAEVQNILDFDRHFPGVREVRLEQNYRSTHLILDAANAVIAKNEARKAKRLWTSQQGGDRIRVVSTPTDDEEARYIAREISQLIAGGRHPAEIAILYRTNVQANLLEESLRLEDVSYELIGGQEFYSRREIKDIIAYLKVCNNSSDEVSLLRIVNVPARGIGDVTMDRLGAKARELGIGVEPAMRRAAEFEELPHGAADKLAQFLTLVDRNRKVFEDQPVHQAAETLVVDLGMREEARTAVKSAVAGAKRVAAIDAFLASIKRYVDREPDASLDGLLKRFALVAREEDAGAQGDAVSLMTLHAAKGLEWPVVFLCGVEEDLLPHSGMQGELQNVPEERRLAYVGITRARERLYLSRAQRRLRRGKAIERFPSRFLEDIPEELLEVVDPLAAPAPRAVNVERDFFAELRAKLKAQSRT